MGDFPMPDRITHVAVLREGRSARGPMPGCGMHDKNNDNNIV